MSSQTPSFRRSTNNGSNNNGSNNNGSNGNGSTTTDELYALELRAEVFSTISAASEVRRGQSDLLETGFGGGENGALDIAMSTETATYGSLKETVGRERHNRMINSHTKVHGRMHLDTHGDNVLMTGNCNERHHGGELLMAGMSDDLIGGIGVRTTAPLDLWLNNLIGMEEKLATVANDVIMVDIFAVGMEREFATSIHNMGCGIFGGTVYTTTATGFMQLHQVQRGLRNTIPGASPESNSSPPSSNTPPPSDGGSSAMVGEAAAGGAQGVRSAGRAGAHMEDLENLRHADEIENALSKTDELVQATQATSARHAEGVTQAGENALRQVGQMVQVDDVENLRYVAEAAEIENVVNQNVTEMLESVETGAKSGEDAGSGGGDAAKPAGEAGNASGGKQGDPDYEEIDDWLTTPATNNRPTVNPTATVNPGVAPNAGNANVVKKLPDNTDIDALVTSLEAKRAQLRQQVADGKTVYKVGNKTFTDVLTETDKLVQTAKADAIDFALDLIRRGEDPADAIQEQIRKLSAAGDPDSLSKALGWEAALNDIDGAVKQNQKAKPLPDLTPTIHTDEEAFPGETFAKVDLDQKHRDIAFKDDAIQNNWNFHLRLLEDVPVDDMAPAIPTRTDDMHKAADGSYIFKSEVPGYAGAEMLSDSGVGNRFEITINQKGDVLVLDHIDFNMPLSKIQPEVSEGGKYQKIVANAGDGLRIEEIDYYHVRPQPPSKPQNPAGPNVVGNNIGGAAKVEADGGGASNLIPNSRPPETPSNPTPQFNANGTKWQAPETSTASPSGWATTPPANQVQQGAGGGSGIYSAPGGVGSGPYNQGDLGPIMGIGSGPYNQGDLGPITGGPSAAGGGAAPKPIVPVENFKHAPIDDMWAEMMQRRELANLFAQDFETLGMATNGFGLNRRAYDTIQSTASDLDSMMRSMLNAHLSQADELLGGIAELPQKLDSLSLEKFEDIRGASPTQFMSNNPQLRLTARDAFVAYMEDLENLMQNEAFSQSVRDDFARQLGSMQRTLTNFDEIAEKRMFEALTQAEQFANWKGLPLRDSIDPDLLQIAMLNRLVDPHTERLDELIELGLIEDLQEASNSKLSDIEEGTRADVVYAQYRADLYDKAMDALANNLNPLPYLQEEVLHAGTGLPIGSYTMNEKIFDLRAFVEDQSMFQKIATEVVDEVTELITSDAYQKVVGSIDPGSAVSGKGFDDSWVELSTTHLSSFDPQNPAHAPSRKLLLRTGDHIQELANIRFQETMEAIGKTDVPTNRMGPAEVRERLVNISEELFIAGEFDKAWEVQKTLDELNIMVPSMVENNLTVAQSLAKTTPPPLPDGVDAMDVVRKLTTHQDNAHQRALELLEEVEEAGDLASEVNLLGGSLKQTGGELAEATQMARLELAEAAYQRSLLYSAMIEDVENGFDPSYIIDGYIKQAEQLGAEADEISQLHRMKKQLNAALGVTDSLPFQHADDLVPDTGLAPVVNTGSGLSEAAASARRTAIAEWLEGALSQLAIRNMRQMRMDAITNMLVEAEEMRAVANFFGASDIDAFLKADLADSLPDAIRLDVVDSEELINGTVADLSRLRSTDVNIPKGDVATVTARVEDVDVSTITANSTTTTTTTAPTPSGGGAAGNALSESEDMGRQFDLLFGLVEDPNLEDIHKVEEGLTEAEQSRQVVASVAEATEAENGGIMQKIETGDGSRPPAPEPPASSASELLPPPRPPKIRHDATDPRQQVVNFLIRAEEVKTGNYWSDTTLLDWDISRVRRFDRNGVEVSGVLDEGWRMLGDLRTRMELPDYALTEFDMRLVRFMEEQRRYTFSQYVKAGYATYAEGRSFLDWFRGLIESDAVMDVKNAENAKLLDEVNEVENLGDLHHMDGAENAENAQNGSTAQNAVSAATPPVVPPKTTYNGKVPYTDDKPFRNVWDDMVRRCSPIRRVHLEDTNAEVAKYGASIDANGAMNWTTQRAYEACRNRILDLADQHFGPHADLLGMSGEESVTAIDRRWLDASDPFTLHVFNVARGKKMNAEMDNILSVYNPLQTAMTQFTDAALADITESMKFIDQLQQQPGTYLSGQASRFVFNTVIDDMAAAENAKAAELAASSAPGAAEDAQKAALKAEMYRNIQEHGFLRANDDFNPTSHVFEIMVGLEDGYDYFPTNTLPMAKKKIAVQEVFDELVTVLINDNLYVPVNTQGRSVDHFETAAKYYDIAEPLQELSEMLATMKADTLRQMDGEPTVYENSRGLLGEFNKATDRMVGDVQTKISDFMKRHGTRLQLLSDNEVTAAFRANNNITDAKYVSAGDKARLRLLQARWQVEMFYVEKFYALSRATDVASNIGSAAPDLEEALEAIVDIGVDIRQLDRDITKIISEDYVNLLQSYLVPTDG